MASVVIVEVVMFVTFNRFPISMPVKEQNGQFIVIKSKCSLASFPLTNEKDLVVTRTSPSPLGLFQIDKLLVCRVNVEIVWKDCLKLSFTNDQNDNFVTDTETNMNPQLKGSARSVRS